MKRLATVMVLSLVMVVVASGAALAKGEPQGSHVQGWPCFLDIFTWHCVSPGVLANLGGPSGPSLNWECDDPDDPLCAEENWGAVSVGPPEGTHFVGTENLIRIDVYGGQPCPTGLSGIVDLPFGTYFFCHHYGESP